MHFMPATRKACFSLGGIFAPETEFFCLRAYKLSLRRQNSAPRAKFRPVEKEEDGNQISLYIQRIRLQCEDENFCFCIFKFNTNSFLFNVLDQCSCCFYLKMSWHSISLYFLYYLHDSALTIFVFSNGTIEARCIILSLSV